MSTSSTTIRIILALMLVSQVSLIFVMLNFEEFLNTLVHFSSSSHDDLVNIVCKIFVAVSFFISVVTAFLEGVEHLRKRHFVHQSTKRVVQPISRPVEEKNTTSVDALVADFDVAKIYLELERDFNHQIALELELDLEHARRRELELELEVELKRKIKLDVVGAVTTVNSESTISDADFLAEQERVIQDALGDPSAQITWGELKCEPTREQLELAKLEREFIKVKQELIKHERQLKRTLALALKLSNSKCQQPVRSVACDSA